MAESFEFLEQIERVEAEWSEVASAMQKLAGKEDGSRVRAAKSTRFLEGMAYAGKLFKDVKEGKRRWSLLREAMATSDFPLYMAGVLDRGLLGVYQETPQTWSAYCAAGTVRDFRTKEEYAFDGLEGVLSKVGQQAEYPEAALTETRYTWIVEKYGRRVPLAWELYINDDLDAYASIPERLARACRRSEDKFATQLHVSTTGPIAAVYSAGNKNIINATNSGAPFVAVNPPLSITALQQAFAVFANMRDADGEPIAIEAAILEVAPAQMITAQNIMNAIELRIVDEVGGGGTAKDQLVTLNWMKQRLTLVVNPYIPIVASASNGNTTWFLHATPSAGRPAFRFGKLRGYEEPGLYIKTPNAKRAGGGEIDPFEGDFDTDSIEHKVRHLFGGTVLDPKMTIGSNGSGA